MNRIRSIQLICPLLLLLMGTGSADAGDLPKKYQDWLNEEVVYIIAPLEKEVFLQLTSDREW